MVISAMKLKDAYSLDSWQIDGETMESVTNLIFLGSKITADGDYSHEIKRRLLLAPGEGNGKPLQYSCLENSMDKGA